MKKKRKLGDMLSILFPLAVAMLWIFSDEVGIDPAALFVLSGLALLLIIAWITVRKSRRKLDSNIEDINTLRQHIGETDNTDQKDKYYF